MNKYILIVLSLFILTGCASKRYAKKAQKFEAAGLYEDAANFYYESLKANTENIDSKLGLRKNGQLVLDKKLSAFTEAYHKSNTKDAVYAYLNASNYFDKINAVGVILNLPDYHKEYYKEVKEKYLYERYIEGTKSLDLEEFQKALEVFDEIIMIDQNYKDARSKYIAAKYEPIYREAIENLDNGYYRTAYYKFEEITKGYSTYKDAVLLKDEALNKAIITIAVIPFYSKKRGITSLNESLQTNIIKEIQNINSPFYKIINNENTRNKIQQSKGKFDRESYDKENSQMAGSLLGVKAILTGKILEFEEFDGKLEKTQKRGWLTYTERVKVDSVTYANKERFKKVNYYEYNQENKVKFLFQFELISTETGEILLTDVFTYEKTSSVHYAQFEGDKSRLVPGYWENENRSSSKDVQITDAYEVKALQNLLSANKSIQSTFSMRDEINTEISKIIAKKIEKYNPEG